MESMKEAALQALGKKRKIEEAALNKPADPIIDLTENKPENDKDDTPKLKLKEEPKENIVPAIKVVAIPVNPTTSSEPAPNTAVKAAVETKKISIVEARKQVDDFGELLNTIEKELETKYGVTIESYSNVYDNLPCEVQIKFIDEFFAKESYQAILDQTTSKV